MHAYMVNRKVDYVWKYLCWAFLGDDGEVGLLPLPFNKLNASLVETGNTLEPISECTMKTLSSIFLVGLLALWTELPFGSSLPPIAKPGNCPILPYFCSIPGGDTCKHDYDCPENQKCCYINCGKHCVTP
ncbi:hypothetical protein JD844_018775 [Phrynosoma platyrhinos]|uniref:WAP domain-containing protein n=1 Tax=Phrynosoma platyrhinos TaxID=52577 RepID=A0ABQ7SP58_PHRPL|nr:hypothetical protein JD844_018775 [Phrynosoma platyrhinos]